MRRLEYQSYAQTDDQVDQQERPAHQQRRFFQHQQRQNQHVSQVKGLAGKKNNVFAHRMPGAAQVIVFGKEKTLEVPEEDVIEREHRVNQQRINVLEAVPRQLGFIRRKAKNAAP